MEEKIIRILFNTSLSMATRLEKAAQHWLDNRQNSSSLLTGEAYFGAQCWLYAMQASTEGAGISSTLLEYMAESRKALGGNSGWDQMLIKKVYCPSCGTRWAVENICYCVCCMNYVCLDCKEQHRSLCGDKIVG